MDLVSDHTHEPDARPPTRRSGVRVALIAVVVVGYLALLASVSIALSLAAPTIRAAEGGAVATRHTTNAWDGHDGSAAATEDGAAADAAFAPAPGGTGITATPPPTDVRVGPGPAHPSRPAWGWVVLGLICFAVLLGLAWPDHNDPA
jgi:hypothetical protein